MVRTITTTTTTTTMPVAVAVAVAVAHYNGRVWVVEVTKLAILLLRLPTYGRYEMK